MNKYCKYIYEENVTCFMELDEELYCFRAIYQNDKNLISTNIQIENSEYGLPEGSFSHCLEDLTAITQREFLELWSKATLLYADSWNKLKAKLVIGDKINAKIICFYPQGIILEIWQLFCAIANYDECRNHFGGDKMYPREEIALKIEGFDDDNLWVRLKI